MKQYDIFDITKLILSFMVVAVHTNLFPLILYPWLRLAVPLFFVISSFLFFSKVNLNKNKKNYVLKKYIKRLLKFYLFWFIILLPCTIYVRRAWFSKGIILGIIIFVEKTLLSSTFIASWYISASIIGTIIIFKASRRNSMIVLLFSIVSYFICTLFSSYSFLLPKSVIITSISPYNSFLISLIYIYVGKMFAEERIKIGKKQTILLLIISLILFKIEHFIILNITDIYNFDCYFSLLPSVILIFDIIRKINVTITNSIIIRQFSNFIYPLHGSLTAILNKFLSIYISNGVMLGLVQYILTILLCFFLFLIVKKMNKRIKILNYSF